LDVVHRDLKPTNVLVSSDGIVKLIGAFLAHMSHSQLQSVCLRFAISFCPCLHPSSCSDFNGGNTCSDFGLAHYGDRSKISKSSIMAGVFSQKPAL
jgi:serine/threonine protein kinase